MKKQMPLIVNQPAEHFFIMTAKTRDGEPRRAVNALSSIWDFRLPDEITCTEEGTERYVDALGGENLTHFFINVNYQRSFFPSKVIEPVWTSLDEPDRQHPSYIRYMKDAFENDLDIYAVMARRCREKRVSPWLSFRMNDIHGSQNASDPWGSTFWKQHPEWHLGRDDSWVNGLDYAQQAVRDRMTAYIREALNRYDVDGIELDFIRFPYYFREGTGPENAPILTEFVRGIRAICEESAKRRGHPVRIAARFLPDPQDAFKMGAAVDVWAGEGLLDLLIVSNMFGSIEYDYHLADWRRHLADSVKLIAGTDNGIIENGKRRILNLDEYRHWIDLQCSRGADGIYFFNFAFRPWRDEAWCGILGNASAGAADASLPFANKL